MYSLCTKLSGSYIYTYIYIYIYIYIHIYIYIYIHIVAGVVGMNETKGSTEGFMLY